MVSFPHAKINLGLNVIKKRSDGYHDITSCFYPIGWYDALEILPSDKTTFTTSGLPIPGNLNENLCLKTYKILQKHFSLPPVQMHLHKVIPMGAGLGGGSSNAAETIKILNTIFNLSLSEKQMMAYAANVGSDCPFFIQNNPVIAKGTGNIFENINLTLKGYFLIVVNPGLHVNTAEAYGSITPKIAKPDIDTILKRPITDWKGKLKNDFEKVVFKKYPEVGDLKLKLYEQGALYASMSGSGSSVYGIFKEKRALKALLPNNYKVWEQVLS